MSFEVLPTKMSVGSCDPQGTDGNQGAGSALGGAQGRSDHLSPAVAAVPLPNPPGKGSAQQGALSKEQEPAPGKSRAAWEERQSGALGRARDQRIKTE